MTPTPQQRRRRRLDRTLYNPAVPLAGKSLRQTINALVKMQTKPVLAGIDRQVADEERRSGMVQGRLQSYYDQLAARQAQLMDRAAQTTQQGNTAQAGIGDQAQQALRAAQQQGQQAVDADAGVRGDIARMGNPQAQLAQRFAEQAGSMATRQAADASRAATYGTAGEQLLQGLVGSSGMRGGEQAADVANRFAQTFRDLSGKRTEVKDRAAGLRADLTTKLRQEGFNNLITQEGLGIKRADLEAAAGRLGETARHNRAMERHARHATDVTRQNSVDSTVSGNLRALAKGEGARGGPSPAERERRTQRTNDFWDRVLDAARHEVPRIRGAIFDTNKQAKTDDDVTAVPWNDETLRTALKSQGYKPYEVDAIIELLPSHNAGKLSPATVKALRGRRIRTPRGRRARPVPASINEGASTLGGVLGSLLG